MGEEEGDRDRSAYITQKNLREGKSEEKGWFNALE